MSEQVSTGSVNPAVDWQLFDIDHITNVSFIRYVSDIYHVTLSLTTATSEFARNIEMIRFYMSFALGSISSLHNYTDEMLKCFDSETAFKNKPISYNLVAQLVTSIYYNRISNTQLMCLLPYFACFDTNKELEVNNIPDNVLAAYKSIHELCVVIIYRSYVSEENQQAFFDPDNMKFVGIMRTIVGKLVPLAKSYDKSHHWPVAVMAHLSRIAKLTMAAYNRTDTDKVKATLASSLLSKGIKENNDKINNLFMV